MPEDPENAPDCETQNGKAKSEIVARIARIVRRSGLDYEGWRLPKVLTDDDFQHRPLIWLLPFLNLRNKC